MSPEPLELWPRCALPGCPNPTTAQGHPCPDCQQHMGGYLRHHPGGTPLTADTQAQRDNDIRAAYTAQRTLATDPEATEPKARAITAAERHLAITAGDRTKPGQLCWLCEQRRACTRIAGRWECADCRHIT